MSNFILQKYINIIYIYYKIARIGIKNKVFKLNKKEYLLIYFILFLNIEGGKKLTRINMNHGILSPNQGENPYWAGKFTHIYPYDYDIMLLTININVETFSGSKILVCVVPKNVMS